MKLEENCSYFIDYKADLKDDSELSYSGPGTYTGEYIKDNEGNTLYLMSGLNVEEGFASDGWFTLLDIKAELKYE